MNIVRIFFIWIALFLGLESGAFAVCSDTDNGGYPMANSLGETIYCTPDEEQSSVQQTEVEVVVAPEVVQPTEQVVGQLATEEKEIKSFGRAPILNKERQWLRKEGRLPLQEEEKEILAAHGFTAEDIARCDATVQSDNRPLGVIRTGDHLEGMAFHDRKGLQYISGRYTGEPELTIQCASSTGKVVQAPVSCGNWTPVQEQSVVVEAKPKPKQKAISVPELTVVIENGCAFEPTLYTTITATVGDGAYSLAPHLNVATHCMKKIGPKEWIGFGVQGLLDTSYWHGTNGSDPMSTYGKVALRVGPSMRYRRFNEAGDTFYDLLASAPLVGINGTIGGWNHGRNGSLDSFHDMSRWYLTVGASGNLGIYAKDEGGKLFRNWEFSAGVDVSALELERTGYWGKDKLARRKISPSTATAYIGVEKHIYSNCSPDAFLNGYRWYIGAGAYANFPDVAAANVGPTLTSCNYLWKAHLGPSLDLRTWDISAIGSIGLNSLDVIKYVQADVRRAEVAERIEKRREQEGLSP